METSSALLAFCANSPVNSHHKCQWGFDAFFDLCLNKPLSKQSGRRWFRLFHVPCRWLETQSRPLWRHCNVSDLPPPTEACETAYRLAALCMFCQQLQVCCCNYGYFCIFCMYLQGPIHGISTHGIGLILPKHSDGDLQISNCTSIKINLIV